MMMLFNWNREAHSETLFGELVSDNYFEVLGVQPHLGRWFLPDENATPAGEPVAVLSYGLWQREFGGGLDIIGRTIKLNGNHFTIVGVAPPAFTGTVPIVQLELWTPLATEPLINMFGSGDGVLDRRRARSLRIFGRLEEGSSLSQARTQLETIAGRLATEYPESNENRSVTLEPLADVRLHPDIDSALLPVAAMLMGLVGLVLLVACANVANMLLARATTRSREIGVRLALGAGRWRLVRQLLTESTLLALLGGTAAFLLTTWLAGLIVSFRPPIAIELALDVSPDARVFLFTLGVSVLTGIVFGLAPALRSSKPDLVHSLKDDATGRGGGRFTLRNTLVVAQVAVSLVLLVAAGLLVRSLAKAHTVELGFDEHNVAYASTSLSAAHYERQEARLFVQQASERVAAIPGVVTVAYATRLPLSLTNATQAFFVEGHEPEGDETSILAEYNTVGPDYFRVLGIPIVAGRAIRVADDARAPQVAVVNEAFAGRYWPNESPLGKRLKFDAEADPWIEVVGVSADYKMKTVGEEPLPIVHTALMQQTSFFETFIVRTSGDPAPIVARLREEISALDPDVSFFSSGTMDGNLATVLFPVRMGTALLLVFGILALGLAAVGVYGVIAYTVSQRTREIGLRIALGARSADVLHMVMWQSMKVVLVGVALGLLGAALLASALGSWLYGVSTIDPIAFLGTAAILLAVALLANYIPARRGALIDPMTALRSD